MADRVGQQLGNYRLRRLLGEGGFAQVYLGQHVHLGTLAAIKLLSAKLGAEEVERFREEARTIARLRHPSIVRVLEFGVEGGVPYLVMDYAAGGTLRQRHPKGAQLLPERIVPYVQQVADALQYAHDLRLIHRDVKPENMLLGERGEVLLSDFGIAIMSQSSRYQSTQDTAGTIAYMAPEQIQGHPRPASDQYSLGIVVYEWLAGERPFTGSMSEVVAQHLGLPPPPLRERLPSIPPALEQVVLTALEKDPRARFASVQGFASALEQASQRRQSIRVRPTSEQPLTPPAAAPPVTSPRKRSAWEEPMPDVEAPQPPSSFAPTRYTLPQQAEPPSRRRTEPPASPLASTVRADAPPGRPATPTPKWVQASEPPPLPPTFSGSIQQTAAPSAPLPARSGAKMPRNKWLLVGLLALVLVLVLGGVGLGFAGYGPLASLGTSATPRASLGTIKEFALPTAKSGPEGIIKGPDGNLWFTEEGTFQIGEFIGGNKIGRITPEGKITEFALPTADSSPTSITTGPDGNLWFTEQTGLRIGRITPGGKITEFTLPTPNRGPFDITAGPDGNLWFTEVDSNQIGRITPEGTLTEFPLPTSNSLPAYIAAGPDGNLWFTELGSNRIGRIIPEGKITEFPIPTAGNVTYGITAGPDGNLWFTESGNKIGRITPAGQITEFLLPNSNSGPDAITTGPDGNLWFTDCILNSSKQCNNKIGRITVGGQVTEFALSAAGSHPEGITTGPDGNLWFTERDGNKIGWISPGP